MSGVRAPDYLEPVHGWRAWIVDPRPEGPMLQSVVRRADWTPGRALRAACADLRDAVAKRRVAPLGHDTPSRHCRCGIHAHRILEEAAHYTDGPSRRRLVTAVGTVALWGTVIEGTEGWRASLAYPVGLGLPLRRTEPAAFRELEEIAEGLERYGVPVGILDCRDRDVAEALRRGTGLSPAPGGDRRPTRPPATDGTGSGRARLATSRR